MGKKKGNQLSYAFHVVLNVGAKRKRFKLNDTDPQSFGVCRSTAYRILKELIRQNILEKYGKRYRLLEIHKIMLTGIEDEMKRALIKQMLEYLNRGFSIQLRLYVAHEARKQLSKILDIPEWLTRDLAVPIINPPQPQPEQECK
jgi:hypothetical protein